jgi:hypothetical protein
LIERERERERDAGWDDVVTIPHWEFKLSKLFLYLTPTTLFFLPYPQNVLETPKTLNSSHLQVWVVCYVHGSLLIMVEGLGSLFWVPLLIMVEGSGHSPC